LFIFLVSYFYFQFVKTKTNFFDKLTVFYNDSRASGMFSFLYSVETSLLLRAGFPAMKCKFSNQFIAVFQNTIEVCAN